MEDGDSLRWITVGSGKTSVRRSDTSEGFAPEICVCLNLRTSKAEVPKTTRVVDVKVDTRRQI
jgi:hypothetical protein